MTRFLWLVSLLSFAVNPSHAQVSILTANGDSNRTNANLNETQLTPQNVSPGNFGRVGSFSTDGQIFAQPLYVSNLAFPDGTAHNVLFIATMHNTVYAYDADLLSDAGLLWRANLGPSFPTSLWKSSYSDVGPEAGILGTGAIDVPAGVLYVVSETLQNGGAAFYLHALDLVTGAERMNGPAVITAVVSGNAVDSLNGQISFDPIQHIQRPGLLLANSSVYVAFGSHMDQHPWHGWIMSYNTSDLTAQQGVFITTPNGEGGAIWQSGRGLAVDDAGGVYSMAGNGDFDGAGEFGESFLKLWGPTAVLADWFTPSNWQQLSDIDADLSAGPAVIPGSHIIVGGDKFGQLYLINGDSMGHLDSGDSGGASITAGVALGGMFNFALWNQSGATLIFVQGDQDVVRSYQVAGTGFDLEPASAGSVVVAGPRVGMTISANGAQDGILWETTGNFPTNPLSGTLHAFDASDLSNELWNSAIVPEDRLGALARFVSPTVANGVVYVATASGSVVAYGLTSRDGSQSDCGQPQFPPGKAALLQDEGNAALDNGN
jgi:hypothetical protein